MEKEIVSGQQSAWSLIKKFGEGDAGEVYLVESLVGGRTGVLKRPQKSAFTGDIVRQAAQIKTEGIILRSLYTPDGLGHSPCKIPELLDQSKPGADFSDRLFIVVEKAQGYDLGFLARISQMGLSEQDLYNSQFAPEEVIFLRSIAEHGQIPRRILLSCLSSLLEVLNRIHHRPVEVGGIHAEGIIYNDIKPEHIFWNPRRATVTIIDWGNTQLAEQNGMSHNRQFSTKGDYRQFVEEMGRFLSAVEPDLRISLGWPGQFELEEDPFLEGGLGERIKSALIEEENRLRQIQQRQENLLQPVNASEDGLMQLEEIQKDLLGLGELPDYPGAARLASGFAARLVIEGDLESLQRVCLWAAALPVGQDDQWKLTTRLAQISTRSQGEMRAHFVDALQAAICSDGEAVLWHLISAIGDASEPNWWYELVGQVRRLQLGSEADGILPLVAVNRLVLSLQSLVRKIEDTQPLHKAGTQSHQSTIDTEELHRLKRIARSLQEDVIATWTQVDPHPPQAFLDYDYLGRLLNELQPVLPNEQKMVERLLSQPRAQVNLVLQAWDRKEFVSASQGLKHILLWDPDRRRTLQAERLIMLAPEWLMKVHMGPQNGEHFQEFATNLEFEGRELRNHVGPASWLDEILECLARLRKGVWPGDMLASLPALIKEMPWMSDFERMERLPAEVKVMVGEVAPPETPEIAVSFGVQEGIFGPAGELRLLEPLDAWAPEARGSSARVYLGEEQVGKSNPRQSALKLMRMDKADYAIPLFREEVQILTLMDRVPGISRMLECGFIHLDTEGPLPTDADLQAIRGLKGDLLRIGPDASQNFLDLIETRTKDGWIPYLSVEKREKQDNLLLLCDAGLTSGRYLPLINLLKMAIQICDILQAAHDLGIVYRDHKILHYYWLEQTNGVYVIDWNVARLHTEGLTEDEKQMDLVQFGARGLHHILTGRAAPGALPLGPTRPDEIETAAQSYRAQWTYDDERLSKGLRDIIEAVLAGQYSNAGKLRDDLKGIYMYA